ncbi:glycoside hydrolase family 3 N-terminal domain-containing protein [Legionella gresilensis]|uniref:glycoside hydrolase family 3 N-terminal domain-containing protein n=1 Tax=Legionella gresilensis TaxID=91823 RepID=UPI0010413458|nr:glycoside hydrolase family 3 N-terminal domain-containing protein [Legionella gresilensis]
MPTLRQQIAQMLIMGFNGLQIDSSNRVSNWLTNEGIGGVILFDKDVTTNLPVKNLVDVKQIIQLTQQLKKYTKANHSFGHLPLLIGVDYEGGAVDRLKNIAGCPLTFSPERMAGLSEDEFVKLTSQMASFLKKLGFNLNFAPSVDLDLNKQEGIIGKLGRSFSADPKKVIKYAELFVATFAKHNINCCYKHFPGHGSATGDTHTGFVDVTTTYKEEELYPYKALATSQSTIPTMIMTAHVINRHLDTSGIPATLSKIMLTDLLRKTFGFSGVIVSDDLQMQAISQYYSMEEKLCLSINAGADMLIFANQLGSNDASEVIDTIVRLVADKAIPVNRIHESYQRILNLKQAHWVTA